MNGCFPAWAHQRIKTFDRVDMRAAAKESNEFVGSLAGRHGEQLAGSEDVLFAWPPVGEPASRADRRDNALAAGLKPA